MTGIPIGITSSAIGLKIWAITSGIKKYNSIIKKKKKKHEKIVSPEKSKLNRKEVLICKSLIYSEISHDEFEFVLINNVLKEYVYWIKFIEYFWSVLIAVLSYCLKCQKNIESKNPKVARTKNGRIMLLSKREFSDSKKSNFIKQQEASRLLSSLGIKAPLNKIPLSGPLLFE